VKQPVAISIRIVVTATIRPQQVAAAAAWVLHCLCRLAGTLDSPGRFFFPQIIRIIRGWNKQVVTNDLPAPSSQPI